MALHQDLLKQARYLATKEPKRPLQASLRRAVSAAYYAMFHLLILEASSRAAPTQPPELRLQLRRVFQHGEMKTACEYFAGKDVEKGALKSLLALPLQDEIKSVASTFVEMQEARHKADYDPFMQFTRADTLVKISTVEKAFIDWKAIRDSDNANVFLSALAFHNRWRR